MRLRPEAGGSTPAAEEVPPSPEVSGAKQSVQRTSKRLRPEAGGSWRKKGGGLNLYERVEGGDRVRGTSQLVVACVCATCGLAGLRPPIPIPMTHPHPPTQSPPSPHITLSAG